MIIISVAVLVGVVLLCAVSCSIYNFKKKYEFNNGKFVVRESYIKR